MPVFEINLAKVKDNYEGLKTLVPNAVIAYALKANYDKKILKTLKALGCSAEVCSDYELGIAKRMGFKKIIRNGYGKGRAWLTNIEVIEDKENVKGLVGARLRLSEKSKLGIIENEVLSSKWDCISIHTHEDFKKALDKAKRIGKHVGAKYIDAGGSLSPERIKLLKKIDNLIIEPGRNLVENACRVISKVLAVKDGKVIIDVGMNFLNKFSNSKFKVTAPGKKDHSCKVYGPIPTDIDNIGFHNLPKLEKGDKVVVENAGAYTLSMASNWTRRIPRIRYVK